MKKNKPIQVCGRKDGYWVSDNEELIEDSEGEL